MFLESNTGEGADHEVPVSIRPCCEADRVSVMELIEPYVQQRKILRRTFEELEELLTNSFVAEMGGKVVGFVALEVYSAKLAEIRSLVVSIHCQGRGIGRRLVAACVERAREKAVFEVMAITSSEEFFRSCGFDYTLPGEKKAFFLQTRSDH
jgi:N-acetylglutamate synthase-like GNAT family acetyltransferase